MKEIKWPYFLDWRWNDWVIAILLFWPLHPIDGLLKTTKWLYLSHLTSNQENKGTLFPSTLKVKGNKIPLFSWLEVKWLRYSHLVVFRRPSIGVQVWKQQYGYNSDIGCLITVDYSLIPIDNVRIYILNDLVILCTSSIVVTICDST